MRVINAALVTGVMVLGLGCTGELIEPRLPGPNPPGVTTAALALRLGGTGADQILAMVSDPAGNVYVTGTFTGTVDFDLGPGITTLTSVGTSDAFLARYSSAGALVWTDRIGGLGKETVTSLARDAAGNLYLGGGFEGTPDFDPGAGIQALISVGLEDGFVAKYAPVGSFLWARRFGGTAADEVRALALDPAGNVYAAGVFSGRADALPTPGPSILSDGPETDGFALSFDPAGAVRWDFAVGGPRADAASAIGITAGGTVVMAGEFTGSADFAPGAAVARLTSTGGREVFLAAYSTGGAYLWAESVGGAGDDTPANGALSLDQSGGFAIAGRFSGTADFDPGVTIASRTSLGAADLFVARYDGGGALLSVFSIGGAAATVAPGGIAFDDGGTLLLAGSFSGSVDFDPGTSTRILPSLATAGSDAFTARYTSGGGLLWVSRFGDGSAAGGGNAAAAVAPDGSGGALIAGRFFASPDFDPGAGTFRLTSLGDADGFVVRLSEGGGLATVP